MSRISVVGLCVFCRFCCRRFCLGPLNARELGHTAGDVAEPYTMGWLCRCDHCGREAEYKPADLIRD
jgi:hypothetical protein